MDVRDLCFMSWFEVVGSRLRGCLSGARAINRERSQCARKTAYNQPAAHTCQLPAQTHASNMIVVLLPVPVLFYAVIAHCRSTLLTLKSATGRVRSTCAEYGALTVFLIGCRCCEDSTDRTTVCLEATAKTSVGAINQHASSTQSKLLPVPSFPYGGSPLKSLSFDSATSPTPKTPMSPVEYKKLGYTLDVSHLLCLCNPLPL
jgi:hypothetical protein